MQSPRQEMFEYLDHLRQSGLTDMFGAAPYLMHQFEKLDKQEARYVLAQWLGIKGVVYYEETNDL